MMSMMTSMVSSVMASMVSSVMASVMSSVMTSMMASVMTTVMMPSMIATKANGSETASVALIKSIVVDKAASPHHATIVESIIESCAVVVVSVSEADTINASSHCDVINKNRFNGMQF